MRLPFLLFVSLACRGDGEPARLAVHVDYDSTMGVDRLVVWGTSDAGAALPQRTIDAPFSLDPPGLRSAQAEIDVDDGLAGRALTIRVDGWSEAGRVVGSGAASATVLSGERAEVFVLLGPPVMCGDGRASLVFEACDDGNMSLGDGCSDLCTVEPGYACAGSPSVCGRCGDGTAQGAEGCDDGNTASGDGCSAECALEPLPGGRVFEVEVLPIATTTSAEFVPVPGAELTVTPNDASERFLLFASGILGSSDVAQVAAEARIVVNGVERDRFGHQTFGAEDNEAGFLTFDTFGGEGGPVRIELHFRAASGVTRVGSVRLVAVMLPPGSDLHLAESNETRELVGDDLDLLSLDLLPSSAGDYVVLAKGTFTEEPSVDTAQVWFVDDRGKEIARYSAPRDPWLPMFAATVRPLDRSTKRFRLMGASSGSEATRAWWNEASRRRAPIAIEVDGMTTPVPAGYPVSFRFDHAAEVAAGRSTPDGADVFVVLESGGAYSILDRVADERRSWNRSDTEIWLATPEAAAGVEPALWLYFGDVPDVPGASDPDRIFSFFDRFDGAVLDPVKWSSPTTAPIVAGGELTVGPGAIAVTNAAFGAGTLLEADVRFVAAELTGELAILTAAQPFDDGGVGFYASARGLVARAGFQQEVPIPFNGDPFVRHTFGLLRTEAGVDFLLDGAAVAHVEVPLISGEASLRIENADPNASMIFDWVRARPIVAAPPVATLGSIEAPSGLLPSRFRDLRIMAFRADVFDVTSASALEPVTTVSPELFSMAELELAAPRSGGDEIVIASARVSGESSEVARKSGVITHGGEVLTRTAHRINRDGSRATGYHHVVGVADARAAAASKVAVGIQSPDGIAVEGASASIVVLRLPR
jgi:cysteine-rich repeat protein